MGNDLGPILLTGASGYLGRHVLGNLKQRRLACIPTSHSGAFGDACGLADASAVKELLARTQPSAIIHCAAVVPKSMAEYDCEAVGAANVAMLQHIVEHSTCPIVLASSMTIYGASVDFPVSEDDVVAPGSGYALGKWKAERVLLARACPGDVALRLPGLFGMPRRAGLLYNAAKSFIAQRQFELAEPAAVWAAMAVEDAAEYVVRAAIMKTDHPVVVDVGYEGEFSISSALALVAHYCNAKWEAPPIQLKDFSMRLERLASLYGILPVTFAQRLEEFVEAVRTDGASRDGEGSHAG